MAYVIGVARSVMVVIDNGRDVIDVAQDVGGAEDRKQAASHHRDAIK